MGRTQVKEELYEDIYYPCCAVRVYIKSSRWLGFPSSGVPALIIKELACDQTMMASGCAVPVLCWITNSLVLWSSIQSDCCRLAWSLILNYFWFLHASSDGIPDWIPRINTLPGYPYSLFITLLTSCSTLIIYAYEVAVLDQYLSNNNLRSFVVICIYVYAYLSLGSEFSSNEPKFDNLYSLSYFPILNLIRRFQLSGKLEQFQRSKDTRYLPQYTPFFHFLDFLFRYSGKTFDLH